MSTTISGTNGVTFPDSTSMQTGQQACKAWVNFNGEGTVAIRDGYNVSSITDNGTGDYTVNFTVAMPDVSYIPITAQRSNSAAAGYESQAYLTTSSVRVKYYGGFSSLSDRDLCGVAIFSN